MFELLKVIFKNHRGAVTSLAMLHIFTFIPAAMVFWMQEGETNHIVYYSFIASVAIISSWVLHWVTKEARYTVKHYHIKMELFFMIMAILAAPFLLTFYIKTALFFSNFFEYIIKDSYNGPNRLISAAVVFGFYHLFFIGDLFRKKNKTEPVNENLIQKI